MKLTKESSTTDQWIALPLEPCDSVDLMVFEVLVVKTDAVWSLCKGLTCESHHRFIGFWNKACHILWIFTLLLRNSSRPAQDLSWNSIFNCKPPNYHAELPIRNWVLPHPPSHKFGRAQQKKCYTCDQAKQATLSYIKMWSKWPQSTFLLHCLSV